MSLLHWSYATLQLTICSPSSYSPLLLRIYPVSTCFQTQFSGAYSASRALYPYVFSCSLPTTISPSLSSSQCAPTSNFPHLLLHPITCTHLGVCLLLSLSLSPVEGHLHALELSQLSPAASEALQALCGTLSVPADTLRTFEDLLASCVLICSFHRKKTPKGSLPNNKM